MKLKKTKILLAILFFLIAMFFSNDFGLIDIEKTAIITAIAVDTDDGGSYTVTAEIAAPEPTKNITENKKTQISGKGDTVGQAIKNVGDISGFFPVLSFCNLVILGSDVAEGNVISAMDYFSRSLRIQDSALLILAEGKGAELLNYTSPLDSVSSFAIQKVILKASGFDADTVKMDVKTFSADYFSDASSSFMPKVKPVQKKKENSGGGESEKETSKKALFSATTTALFLRGEKVGELSEEQTVIFNILSGCFKGSTLPVKDVPTLTGENDYLLTVLREKPKIDISADNGKVTVNISLSLYCKISDENSTHSDADYIKDLPLPIAVTEKAEEYLKEKTADLLEKSKATDCDFLKLKEKLYRKDPNAYRLYKENLLKEMTYFVSVNVTGQS